MQVLWVYISYGGPEASCRVMDGNEEESVFCVAPEKLSTRNDRKVAASARPAASRSDRPSSFKYSGLDQGLAYETCPSGSLPR